MKHVFVRKNQKDADKKLKDANALGWSIPKAAALNAW